MTVEFTYWLWPTRVLRALLAISNLLSNERSRNNYKCHVSWICLVSTTSVGALDLCHHSTYPALHVNVV